MDKREQALKDFPNEVEIIEQCNCKYIGYTIWPDKIVRFSFNTVNGDTLVVEQKECNKDKIIEKVNEAFKRRNKNEGFGQTCCLLPGTLVRVKSGYKKIEDMRVGEEVSTHLGRWKKVTHVIKNKFRGRIRKILKEKI